MTIKDIAQLAGTSKSTVSRYFNGGSISRETAEQIRAAVSKLDYSPNLSARRLATSKSHTLGVVFDDIANYIYGDMIAGFQEEAHRCGYECMFFSRSMDSRTEESFLPLFSSCTVDGLALVSVGRRQHGQVKRLAAAGHNLVLVGDNAGVDTLPAIDVDNAGGTRAEVAELIARGHRCIAYLEGPMTMPAAQARREGYLQALRDAGIEPEPELIRRTDWAVNDAYRVVRSLLETADFTALVGSNAYSTYGGMLALIDAGKRVPEDVMVVGFDDDPLCEHTRPAITTMKQPFREIAHIAVQRLIAVLEGESPRPGAALVMP